MSSQLPNPLQLLEIIHQAIVKLFRERNWPTLLLVIVFIIFLGFGPKIDQLPFLGIVIFSINKEPPTWYWVVFWITEVVIFSVSVRLELRKEQVDAPQSTPDSGSHWIKLFILFLLTVVLVVVGKLIVVPLGQHVIESSQASNPNQNTVLECDTGNNKDCFSWGENILISNSHAFKGEEDWKRKCRDDWKFKRAGTRDYEKRRFADAATGFNNFVISCPNDPEAWIYLNNAKYESDGNPIRIAVSVPISRQKGEEEAFDSQQALRGVALAQEQINENSGIQKRKLLVGIVDDRYKIVSDDIETKEDERKKARNIADFISKNRDILGVIGHSSSDATEAAAEVYNQQKLVAISPTSTAVRKPQDREGVKLGEYVFRTASNDSIAAELLARKASELYRSIAIVYDGGSKYSSSFKKAFETAFEHEQGQIVNKDIVNKGEEDRCDISKNAGYKYKNGPSECLEQAKKVGKDGALLLVPSSANVKDVESLIKLNFEEASPLPLLGSDTMYDKRFLSATAKDMIIIVPWHRHIQPSKFETEAKEVFGYKDEKNEEQEPFKINWETAMAYDATQALAEGLRKASQSCFLHPLFLWDKYAQSTCLRKELKNTLSNTNFKANGVLGVDSVKFDQYGDRAKGNGIGVLVNVCEVKNSKVNSQRKEKEFEFRRTDDNLQCIDS